MGGFFSSASEVTEPWGTYTLIDVRTKEEWDSGHIEGAILIPHNEIAEKIGEFVKDKSRPIKLYCRSGGRAGMALNQLQSMGYENVQNLGGYSTAKQMIKDNPSPSS